MVRNHEQTGEYFLSTISSINLYEYRAAWNIAYRNKRGFFSVQRELQSNKQELRSELGLNEAQLATHVSAEALRIIIDTPVETIIQGGRGFLNLYLGIFNSAIDDLAKNMGITHPSVIAISIKALVICHLVAVYLGCLWFGLYLLRGQKDDLVKLSIMLITYFTFTIYRGGNLCAFPHSDNPFYSSNFRPRLGKVYRKTTIMPSVLNKKNLSLLPFY